AEAGIRDGHVTGVQTCALPIYRLRQARLDVEAAKQDLTKFLEEGRSAGAQPAWLDEGIEEEPAEETKKKEPAPAMKSIEPPMLKIGRASCRKEERWRKSN